MQSAREKLIELLTHKSYQEGDFLLSSDQSASYYIDAKASTLSGDTIGLIAELLLEKASKNGIKAIGGLTLGADPIASAVALVAHQHGMDITGFIVRKKPKTHGTQKFIEGPPIVGMRVMVVDDVVTTGGSILDGYNKVVEAGADVACLMSIVHRGPGRKESVLPKGVPYHYLVDVKEIIEFSKHAQSATA